MVFRPGLIADGTRFGRLVVVCLQGSDKWGSRQYDCLCDCGGRKVVVQYNLTSGHVRSCGCLQRERRIKHGMSSSPEYVAWLNMRDRCFKEQDPNYKNYGGRGITVCDRWKDSFQNFYEDMGPRPSGLTLERVDNNGNYEPNNCEWATRAAQLSNRRAYTKYG